MSTEIKRTDPNAPALSEKARRLLAAHDREVGTSERAYDDQPGLHAYRLAS